MPSYTYDNKGNLIFDDNKGIADIRYNYLNLPERIDFGSGDSINFIYDATGVKPARLISGTETGEKAMSIPIAPYEGRSGFSYDPRSVVVTTEGKLQSGVAGFIHEMGHVYISYKYYKEYKKMIKDGMSPNNAATIINEKRLNDAHPLKDGWTNTEEKYVIQNYENPMMEFMKQATRNNHRGKNYKTAGPFTTAPKDEAWGTIVKEIIKKYVGN